jgi:hypothetical protein
VCVMCAAFTCKSRPVSDGSTVCATSDAAETPVQAGLIKRGLACFKGINISTCAQDGRLFMIATGCAGDCMEQVSAWINQNEGCKAASTATCSTTLVTPPCGETADGAPRRTVCHFFVTARRVAAVRGLSCSRPFKLLLVVRILATICGMGQTVCGPVPASRTIRCYISPPCKLATRFAGCPSLPRPDSHLLQATCTNSYMPFHVETEHQIPIPRKVSFSMASGHGQCNWIGCVLARPVPT